jgi:hypothetical protein
LCIGRDSLRVIFQAHVAVADELVHVIGYHLSLSQVLAVDFDGCHTITHPLIASRREEQGLGIALIIRIVPQESLESFDSQLVVSIQKVTFSQEKTGFAGLLLRGLVG